MKHPLNRLFAVDPLNDDDGNRIFRLLAPIGIWFGVSSGLRREIELLSSRLSTSWSSDLIGAIGAWQMAAEGRNDVEAYRYLNSTSHAKVVFRNFCASTASSPMAPYSLLRLARERHSLLQKISHLSGNLRAERVWQEIQEEGLIDNINAITRRYGAEEIDYSGVSRLFEKKLHSAGIGRSNRNHLLTRFNELVEALNQVAKSNLALSVLEEEWPRKYVTPQATFFGSDNLTAFLSQPLLVDASSPDPIDLAVNIISLLDEDDTDFMARVSDLISPLVEDEQALLRVNDVPMGQTITGRILQKQGLTKVRNTLAEDGADVAFIDMCLEENDLDQADDAIKRINQEIKEDSELKKLADRIEIRSRQVEIDPRFAQEGPIISLLTDAKELIRQRRVSDVENALQELAVLMCKVEVEQEQELVREKVAKLNEIYPAHPIAAIADEMLLDNNVGLALLQRLKDIRSRLDEVVAEIEVKLESDFRKELDEIEALLDNPRLHPDAREQGRSRVENLQVQRESGQLSSAIQEARSFVDLLTRRIATTWTSEEGEINLLNQIEAYIQSHAVFPTDDIRRLFIAMKTKPFVLLAGMTGSGKSTLARLMAESLGATRETFRRIAVRPDWIDQSESLGFINPLSSEFQPGWLAQIMRKCETSPDRLFFVLLDEMNLAPVEQYMADALSSMEERFQGSERAETPLYLVGNPINSKEWPESIAWPENLFIIGTVNIDETTRALSERVLDRSSLIQIVSQPSRTHHDQSSLRDSSPAIVPYSEWTKICSKVSNDSYHDFLDELSEKLMDMRIGLGSRTHNYIESFMANSVSVMDETAALDFAVLQRVIPKIRGYKYALRGLPQLRELFEEYGLRRCVAVLGEWNSPEISDDAFLDGTDPKIGLIAHYDA